MSSTPRLATPIDSGQVLAYLHLIAGDNPTGLLIDVRYRLADGNMAARFYPADRPELAARRICRQARHTDVYTGVLLRTRRNGTRQAVAPSHLVFIDTDTAGGVARIREFAHQPTMLIASGSGGAHAYWALHDRINSEQLERANKRLANHLAGDPASVDCARILRPCGSLNHKHSPPAPVRLLEHNPDRRYQLDALVDDLPDPPARAHLTRVVTSPRQDRSKLDRQLLAIAAADYVRELAGLEPNRAGKVHCPFHHPDDNPSLQLYPDGTWCCFASHGAQGRIGGTIYDFAARKLGYDTKGSDFIALRKLLAERFRLI